MANTLTATCDLTVRGSFEKDTDLTSLIDAFATGSNDFDAITMELTNGTGTGQANSKWEDTRTLAASGNDDLDLAGGLTDAFGATITFTKIKFLVVTLDAPDGTLSLRVGPQGVANAWQGPFGGTGATVYKTVTQAEILVFDKYGFSVTAATGDILRINNPSASSVVYHIFMIGTV